jgi:ABC-type lipoprotein export system ATPase subunit
MTEPRSTQACIEARALRRVFRQGGEDLVAVSEASCTIRPGDRIAIRGPSGSGKSTLLHLFSGLDSPTSGDISWPACAAPKRLRPAYISIALQVPDLMPALTVLENVSLPVLLNGSTQKEAQSSALEILKALDLADLAYQLPEELSGGQAQRVVLGRALATRPRLILADEPTGQLDHPTAQHLFDHLFAVLNGGDTALVIATHDHSVSDRMEIIWNMHQGILTGATRQ